MEAKRNISRNWLIAAVVVGTMMLCVGCAKKEGKVLARDDFDGEFTLDWQILNADPTHFSLTKYPGTLTITTQQGGFYRSATNFKNLFLIDNPVAGGGDFQVTTCIVAFAPTANYHQAGLVCFNDEDNYIKWTYEWNGARGQQVFALIRETQGSVHPHTYVLDIPKAERVWFRLSKRSNRYTYSTSTDGKSFRVHGELPWGDGVPKSVGLVATNADYPAPEVDASFDFFEVRALPAEPPAEAGAKYVISEANLKIPEEMQTCAENLKKIYTAIKKYEKDKDNLPNWLSDLVPDYLSKETLLCSDDRTHTDALAPDPRLPCSYSYQFSPNFTSVADGRMRYRDWKKQQVKFFGDIVPMVRCRHHGAPSRVLNISAGGQVYYSPGGWEGMFIPEYTRGVELPRRPAPEVQPVPAEPAKATGAKYVISDENLKIPEELQTCAENLKKIHTAIKKYEKDKDKLPDWLSDLVPDYLSKENLLCPDNPDRTKSQFYPDPNLPCSYCYEFSVAPRPGGILCRDWKKQQVKFFGNVVPMVRCMNHGSANILNVSVGAQIYYGRLSWESLFMPNYRYGVEFPGGPPQPTAVTTTRTTTPRLPLQPPSLVGKSLPDLNDLQIQLPPADVNDRMILVCFWDMDQRPSRYCIRQLAEKAEQFKDKGVTIIAVQASKVDKNNLNEWVQKYNVSFPVGMIEGDVEKAKFTWGVRSLPWLILTDTEHIVRTDGFGTNELNEKIKAMADAVR